jgi:hypothetical protein
VELTKTFRVDQYADALESWRWLDLSAKEPLFTSLFGSVFFDSADGCWHLDMVDGTLGRPWSSGAELETALETDEGRDRYLLAPLARQAVDRGIALAPHEVYDFSTPPVLGGPLDPANLSATDFVVALNLAGQIHDQVRTLPPGTKINEVTID